MGEFDAENKRVTRVKRGITDNNAIIVEQFLEHINHRNNPHLTTLTQLGITAQTLGSNEIYNEVLTGLINSSNVIFTTSVNFVSGSIRVYLNGLRLKSGAGNDYTETGGNQITFEYAPKTGSVLIVDFLKL